MKDLWFSLKDQLKSGPRNYLIQNLVKIQMNQLQTNLEKAIKNEQSDFA